MDDVPLVLMSSLIIIKFISTRRDQHQIQFLDLQIFSLSFISLLFFSSPILSKIGFLLYETPPAGLNDVATPLSCEALCALDTWGGGGEKTNNRQGD